MTGQRPETAAPRVVALGGGHGLYASLSALRRVTSALTAVVTVADDGGSSGRLRAELGALPPGDLRMALAALAGDDDWGRTWADLLQHRFGGSGALAGHPVGNLVLAGLAEMLDDPVAALDWTHRLLGGVGRVLPMSPVPLEIVARVASVDPDDPVPFRRIRGQVAVATTPGRVVEVHLVPEQPPACAAATAAVRDADWVVLGPGSWFSSVLPHLLVPELRRALIETPARRLVSLNLAPQQGETDDFAPEAYLEVLRSHAPELRLDVVLADEATVDDRSGLSRTAESMGARLVLAPVATDDGTPRHDATRLAAVYRRLFVDAGRPGGAECVTGTGGEDRVPASRATRSAVQNETGGGSRGWR